LALTVLFPAFGSGDADVANLATILEALGFRVGTQVANQNDLVD
jgi:hypothetical protein